MSAEFQITGPKGDILVKTRFCATGVETVYDGIRAVCNANGIEIEIKGSGSFAYVSSIDGIKEFETGAMSGWVYAKNGVYSTKGIGSEKLSDGDYIWFYYSNNLGADFQETLSGR